MDLLSLISIGNLDIVIMGLVAISIGTLGVIVFFNNPASITNKTFLAASLTVILWGVINMMVFRMGSPESVIWTLRIGVFFAVWHAFAAFQLFLVFPKAKANFRWWYYWGLIPFVAAVSLLALSPLVFESAGELVNGRVGAVNNGPLVPIFGLTVVALHAVGLGALFRRILKTERLLRTPYVLIFVGATITYLLIILFNFIFPALLNRPDLAPYAGIFTFPYIGLTAYALIKHKLLNIKIVTTEILATLLALIALIEIFTAEDFSFLIFKISIFVLVLIFSYLLIAGVIREVQQREQIQVLADNLKIANSKLKELDKLKSEFLSIATHELRTPLTIVRNFISLMVDGSYGKVPEAMIESGHQVFERVEDMMQSVNTYLNVSRIEQGKMKYDLVDVDLTSLVKSSFEGLKISAEKKNLELKLNIAQGAEKLLVKGDAPKLTEVITNLIDNSIKYTPAGTITITVEKLELQARIVIKDTGVGMTKKTMDNLFKLFSPGEDSKKINPSSTGVGLYVSKSHVEAHRGTLVASSDGPGKGSVFVVSIPAI